MSLLKSLLPVAAGIALSPFLTPMGAAAVVGGVGALRSKKVYDASTQDALMQGLMAGAGAYGGANIARGLGALGGADTAVKAAGTTASASSGTPAALQAVTTPTVGMEGVAGAAGASQPMVLPTYSQIGAGTSRLFTEPGSLQTLSTAMGGTPQALTQAGLAALPVVPELMKPATIEPVPEAGGEIRPYEYQPGTVDPMAPYNGSSVERQWFRPSYAALPPKQYHGGGMAAGVAYTRTPTATASVPASQMGLGGTPAAYSGFGGPALARLARQVPPPLPPRFQYAQAMQRPAAAPGRTGERIWVRPTLTAQPRRFAEGGRLMQGPGDGVSDHIPAVLDNNQPARLADGEFVIPARDVAELGNGSTAAGARQLYAMLDRLEKSRKQAKRGQDMKPAKHLPA